MKRKGWLCLLFAATLPAQAQIMAPLPRVDIVQQPGAALPLSGTFTDDDGRAMRLADFFGQRPVVLVPGYYHCPNLCSTLMMGVLESLAAVHLPADSYRVLGISIDPAETPDTAARRKPTYAALIARAGGELHLLTGADGQVLARHAGFQVAFDATSRQYAHPAGFLVATPDGRIAHYFLGVRFDPRDVRLALVDASQGRIGSPVDRLLLLCAHYDPALGRYSATVMNLVRAICLLVLALLAGWIAWRARRMRGGP